MEKEIYYILGTVDDESLFAFVILTAAICPEIEIVTDAATYLEMNETCSYLKDAGFPVKVLTKPMTYVVSRINKTILISLDNYPIIKEDLSAVCTEHEISCVGLGEQDLELYYEYPMKFSE